jgi:hypothetical protein
MAPNTATKAIAKANPHNNRIGRVAIAALIARQIARCLKSIIRVLFQASQTDVG